jgi:aspartyl/asparaginyl beta-hydroxylase (cupin superfamily)
VFEDTVQFPFAANLERHWLIIRDEMVALRSTSFILAGKIALREDGLEHLWPLRLWYDVRPLLDADDDYGSRRARAVRQSPGFVA